MTQRMLINGRHSEEVRMAILNQDGGLEAYSVAVAEAGAQRGNIYRGIISNIEPSLDAAFVDYGSERNGFLAFHDVMPQAYHNQVAEGKKPTIDVALTRGQPIDVQVTRDAEGHKGATLTTNLSLAGRFMVLMPYEDSRGVSRKVEDEDLRRKLREKVKNLVADSFGFIVRTNAADQTKTELKADLDQLKRLWTQVQQESDTGHGPRLLYNDQDVIIQVLRDRLDGDVTEIVVDDEELFQRAQRYLQAVMPRHKFELTHYSDRLPLFSRYNIEPKIAAIHKREVKLPGGGAIVIDPTEALTAIDVNSGKAKGGDSQQATAVATNLEAAAEVARQLRLRDIGGLVVVDFIDMRQPKHRKSVERAIRDAMKQDKARSSTGRLSSNGLLEINRQRLGKSLQLRTHVPCPTCSGYGRLVNPDLLALSLLRRVEARAATGRLHRVVIGLHPEIADAVQNRRRAEMAALERELRISIEVHGRNNLRHGDEQVEWVNREGNGAGQHSSARPSSGSSRRGDDAQSDESRSKRRRRRRNRRKRDSAPEASAPAVQQPEQPASAAAEQHPAAAEGSGRGSPQEPSAAEAQSPDNGSDEEREGQQAAPNEQRGGRRGSRRRSRRSRRRSSRGAERPRQSGEQPADGDSAQTVSHAGPQPVPSEPDSGRSGASDPAADAMASGSTSDDASPPSRRRRTRRRRRPTRSSEPTMAPPPQEQTAAAPHGLGDAPAAQPSQSEQRREPRASSAGTAATPATSAAPPQGAAPAQPAPRPEPEGGARAEAPRPAAAGAPITTSPPLVASPAQQPQRDAGAAPKEAAPKEAAPKEAAPKDAPPRDAAPKDALPKEAAPKKAAPKEPAPKDTPPKKATTKKAATKKATTKKATTKKATTKKTATKKAATKKATTKKATTKKAATKKAATKKAATKKATTKKAATKKAATKKAATRKSGGASGRTEKNTDADS